MAYTYKEIIDGLNKLKLGWICLDTYIGKRRMAKLQHFTSKEVIICRYDHAKQNHVRFSKYEDIKRFTKCNKLGLKVNPQYDCVSSNCGYRGTQVLVSIKRKDSRRSWKSNTY